MTKFDIFVVNLKRSADRREAMKRKIKRIRGFKKIYIDNEMVCDGNSPNINSSLGAPCGDFGNLGRFADAPVQSHAPNSQKTPQLPPQILELDSNKRDSTESKNSESALDSAFSKQKTNSSIFDEKSGLCSHERGNKTDLSIDEASGKLPDLSQKDDEFAESTLHFHFFPATDATKFKNGESPLPPQYSSKLTRFVKGKDLSFGEIACFSSHYRLWQKCVEVDSPIIILEDDIDFMQDFCQIIEIFKSPFKYVRLYYLFDRKITHLYDNFYISFGRTAGTQGYYLTPQAAQKFIKNARFWLFCVDDYMDMFFIHSVKNIIFKPFIISEDSLSAENSTILGREKPKMRFYQKLTRELSRIYFFMIRKYVYFALHCVELRAFFRANRR